MKKICAGIWGYVDGKPVRCDQEPVRWRIVNGKRLDFCDDCDAEADEQLFNPIDQN